MDQIYKGLLTLSVILMFAAALIAGQARGHVPADGAAGTGFAIDAEEGLLLDAGSLREFDTLPIEFDTALALPIVIELGREELSISGGAPLDRGFNDSHLE